MRMGSRLVETSSTPIGMPLEDTKPRNNFGTFGDDEVVVVEPTDPDEDRLVQEEMNRATNLAPMSTSIVINRSHPLNHSLPNKSTSTGGMSTIHCTEAIPVVQLAESPKTVGTVAEALQSLLSATSRLNQFQNISVQPLLAGKVNASTNLVTSSSTSAFWIPSSGTTTTTAPTPSTNSITGSFEDITKLAQHMAPLNPLAAAVLVNCATVNLISQLANSPVTPVYNTNAFTPSTGLLQNGGTTLSGLLPTLLSNFNPDVPSSKASGSNAVPANSREVNSPEPRVAVHPPISTPVSPHACPATPVSPTTLTFSMTEAMNRATVRIKRFKCSAPNCSLAFYSRFNLAEHVRTHTGERPFICPDLDCPAAFKRRRDLRDHWNAHLSRISNSAMTMDSSSKTDTVSEGEVVISRSEAPECSTVSSPVPASVPSSPPGFSDIIVKVGDETDVPGDGSDPDYLHEDDQSTTGRYRCPFHGCHKSYARRHRLNQHVSWHTGTKPFQCDEPNCKIRYYSEGDLRKHKLTHLNASDRSHRRRHACPYPNCGKAYSKMNKLKEHVRSHTGERPYVCREPGCGAAFIRLYGVRRHELTHVFGRRRAKRLPRIPTAAPATPSQTPLEPSVSQSRPLRIEQPQPNAITDAVSSILASLGLRPGGNEVTSDITASSNSRALPAIAPKTTTPVSLRPLSPISGPPGMRRPHVCPFKDCGKAFPKLNKLREHVCRHTGERPYVCDKCTASFVRMYDLRRHGNIHLRGAEPRSGPRILAPRPHEFQNEITPIPHAPMQPEAETVPVN